MKTAMPLPVRFLNMVGRSVNTIGFQPLNLSLDKLLQTASDNTGLSDFGEGDFRQPLALLLEGLEKEANLYNCTAMENGLIDKFTCCL